MWEVLRRERLEQVRRMQEILSCGSEVHPAPAAMAGEAARDVRVCSASRH